MSANAFQLRAVSRLHRQEDTGQVGTLRYISLVARLLILIAIAVTVRLHMLTEPWHALPDADRIPRLWLLILGAWFSILFMAALATLQSALDRNEIGIMLPMPIEHATRWRLVLLRVASSFGLLGIGGPLVSAIILARFGIAWGVVSLILLPAAICLGVLLSLFIAWLLGNGTPRRRAITITFAIPALLVIGLSQATGDPETLTTPLVLVPDAILIPAIVIGIGARRLGQWYLTLAQELHAAPVHTRDCLGPLSRALGSLLIRSRTPWAAIALKELRVQARDVFLLLRIVVMLAAPLLFLAITGLPILAEIDMTRVIAAWALLLSIYCAIETTPSPFGGEGNRLTLALLASPGPASLITGKALAVITPLVAQTWLVILILAIWHDVPIMPMVVTAALATIAVTSIGFVITCLSTRDIDLDQHVEGGAQAILVEHVPNTPVRLAIVGCALALALGASFAIIALPFQAAAALILGSGSLLAVIAFRDSGRRMASIAPA